jgi:hypothetical protein
MKAPPMDQRAVVALGISLLAICGCGAPAPTVVDVALPPSGTASFGPSGEGGSEAVAGAGCSWKAAKLMPRGDDVLLCFDKAGACFARAASFTEGHVGLTLPEGDVASAGARVELRKDGVRIEAWTTGEQVLLGPKGALAMGGVVVPQLAEVVRVDRVTGGRTELSLVPGDGVRLRSGPLRASASCGDLALANPSFEEAAALEALGVPSSTLGERTLTSAQPVAIAAGAAGPAVLELELELEEEETSVELIDVRGSRSRILWERSDMTVAGWVDSSLLGPSSGAAFGAGGLGLMGRGAGRSSGVTCPSSMPLFADVAGVRRRVGSIDAQTEFDPGDRTGEWATVGLRTDHLSLEENARWVIRVRDLERCVGE